MNRSKKLSNKTQERPLPSNFIKITDAHETRVENIVYSTLYKETNQKLTLRQIGLVKNLVIEGPEFLTDSYDVGILIPTYNRVNYFKYCLQSISDSYIDKKVILC